MKTITFHSYKGGVGRTLALANLGIALSAIGKRVLMLDWDFDAPGLAIKWDVEKNVRRGYVDYLDECASASNYGYLENIDHGDRKRFLEEYVIEINDNLFLLPAGATGCDKYWNTIASSEFRRYFSYNDKERKKDNQNFFLSEKEILSKLKNGIDYLLIDCKTGDERAAVPILVMADSVVELMICNREGVFGDILVRRAIEDLNVKCKEKNIDITSVMTRVPANTTNKFALEEYEKIKKIVLKNDSQLVGSPVKIELLHEQRELETAEALVLLSDKKTDEDKEKNNENVLLSHDYIDLFEELFRNDPEIVEAIELLDLKSWKNALNLAESVRVIERFFTLELDRGELLNDDNEPNVSLRIETLAMLLATLVDHPGIAGAPNEEIERVFEYSGTFAGKSFGEELMVDGKIWKDGVPKDINERLSGWCRFDKEAGFGNWEATYDFKENLGSIILYTHFLTNAQTKANTNSEFAAAFLKGYISNILLRLFKDQTKKPDIDSITRLSDSGKLPLVFEFKTK